VTEKDTVNFDSRRSRSLGASLIPVDGGPRCDQIRGQGGRLNSRVTSDGRRRPGPVGLLERVVVEGAQVRDALAAAHHRAVPDLETNVPSGVDFYDLLLSENQ
jgi:hypothetical protein